MDAQYIMYPLGYMSSITVLSFPFYFFPPVLSGGETAGVVIGALAMIAVFVVLNVLVVKMFRNKINGAPGLTRQASVVSSASNKSGVSTRNLVA